MKEDTRGYNVKSSTSLGSIYNFMLKSGSPLYKFKILDTENGLLLKITLTN